MRSKWTDKATGKVINLSNYAYSQMSGWNGYPIVSFNDLTSWVAEHISESTMKLTKPSSTTGWLLQIPKESISNVAFKLRVSTSTGQNISLYYVDDTNSVLKGISLNNGLNDIPAYGDLDFTFAIINASTLDVGGVITLEQLPLYPGALVSDGVDDRGISSEVLGDTEQVGSILAMAKFYGTPTDNEFLFFAGLAESNIAIFRSADDRIYGRIGSQNQKEIVSSNGVFTLSDSPVIPNRNFLINYSGASNYCHSILSRLILIKEQLDEYQQEFFKWKVEKEYRDWCKANGYDYAIPEMISTTN